MAETMSGHTTASAEDGAGAAVQEKAQEAVEQVRGQAHRVAGQASERARQQVDQRSTQAGERLVGQADDLRTLGRELRSQGKEGPAKLSEQVAERTERVGTWLRESDGDRILEDVEEFGRRNPWAVAVGGVVAGFVASRFLKASSGGRYASRSQGSGSGAQARFDTRGRTVGGQQSSQATSGATEDRDPLEPLELRPTGASAGSAAP